MKKLVPIKMLVIKFPIKAKHGDIEIGGVKFSTPFCGECAKRWPERTNFINIGGTCFCEDCLIKHFNKESGNETP